MPARWMLIRSLDLENELRRIRAGHHLVAQYERQVRAQRAIVPQERGGARPGSHPMYPVYRLANFW